MPLAGWTSNYPETPDSCLLRGLVLRDVGGGGDGDRFAVDLDRGDLVAVGAGDQERLAGGRASGLRDSFVGEPLPHGSEK